MWISRCSCCFLEKATATTKSILALAQSSLCYFLSFFCLRILFSRIATKGTYNGEPTYSESKRAREGEKKNQKRIKWKTLHTARKFRAIRMVKLFHFIKCFAMHAIRASEHTIDHNVFFFFFFIFVVFLLSIFHLRRFPNTAHMFCVVIASRSWTYGKKSAFCYAESILCTLCVAPLSSSRFFFFFRFFFNYIFVVGKRTHYYSTTCSDLKWFWPNNIN